MQHRAIPMNSDRTKRASMTFKSFNNYEWYIFSLCVIAAFAVTLIQSHWSFADWLREVFSTLWPAAVLVGLLSLLAAHAHRTQKHSDGAYRFMRISALAFLAAVAMLWIVVRHYL